MLDFSVQFGMPRNGWMDIALKKQNEPFTVPVSYIGYPHAPFELVRCLANVMGKKQFAAMIWYLEPEEYHFEFKTEKNLTRFKINEPLPHEQVKTHFEIEIPSLELVLAFWRGLRCLQSQILDNEFQEGWHSPFPDDELARLTEQLREIKRKQ